MITVPFYKVGHNEWVKGLISYCYIELLNIDDWITQYRGFNIAS